MRLASNGLELGARLRDLDQVALLLLQKSLEFVGCELLLGAQVDGLMFLLEASERVERGVVLGFDALDLLFHEGERAPVFRAGVLAGLLDHEVGQHLAISAASIGSGE